jgi:hypothetical protein
VRPGTNTAVLTLQADAETLEPGTRGNLILKALAAGRRTKNVLCTAPAIPFEIVAAAPAPDS